jgi:KaiC/GvpD/RAD55 family RecA-like ATPase
MSELNPGEALFKQYGKSFQEKIFQGLLTDHTWAAQMTEVMSPAYFDLKYLAYLSDKYFKYHTKYKAFPTMALLISIIKDELKEQNNAVLKEQIVEYLGRMRGSPDMGDIAYVKDKALDFCRKQALREALEKSVELISGDKYDAVVDLMRKAVSVGLPVSVGHDFFEDMEARFVKINRLACPTGLEQLDQKSVLNGGLGRGELGVIVANTGVGKSHMLVSLGAQALKLGKNVVHYTLELSETAVGIRYDSHLTGIASNEIQDSKQEVLDKYKDMELGKLIIKEYPTGGATVNTIRNHLEKLSLRGITPSMLLIDYADIMRSSREHDALRLELKLIYEELRNLAMERGIPIWTASQANRDSSNSDVVGLENMSESYGKAMVADVVISLSRKPTEKATGSGRLFVAKNRAGRDGILFPVHIDTARSTIKILEESELTLQEAMNQDDNDRKKLIKEKWNQVMGAK